MGIDYYAVLDVFRDATNIEIKLAYRKWAAISHPDYKKHPCDVRCCCRRPCCPGISNDCYWFLLNEAYDVLSDTFHREIYDLHGEKGLKCGVATKNGYFPGYLYHGNCRKTYESVFGSYSPYADIIDAVTQPPALVSTADGSICPKKKDADVERLIYVDLKEVFYGGFRKMKILRHEFIDDLKVQTNIKEKSLIVPIKQGICAGTEIRFTEEGDQGVGIIPADIVFIVADEKHKHFTREGADLHITKSITLREALCGYKVSIKTVDNRTLVVAINDVIHPDYCHTFTEEGLPYPDDSNNNRKGHIHVHFNVEYPKYIPRIIKNQLNDLLDTENDANGKPDEMDQMKKMNNVAKLIMRQKIEKENEKAKRKYFRNNVVQRHSDDGKFEAI